jgi:MFS family permease
VSTTASSRPDSVLPKLSYAVVLRTPYACRAFGVALLGRLSYGMVSVAVMLAVTRATGSYAVAGTVMALFGAAVVLLSPLRAALVDRYGRRRALVPLSLFYGGLLCALAVLTWRPGAPVLLIGAVAVAAGLFPPPLGPTMRAVWAELLDDRRLLERAYSLDAVAEDLLFVSGPLVVGVVVQWAPPAAGVALSALLVTAGTLAFVTSPGVGGVRPADPSGAAKAVPRKGLRAARGLAQPVAVAAAVGLALGALDLLVLAFAELRHAGDGAVPWVLAALSAGSVAGGLLNGALTWRAPARVRAPRLALALGAILTTAALAPGLATLTAAAVCAGLFVAPALTTAYLLADESAAPGSRTQAGAWVNTAVNGGSTAGTALAGALAGAVTLPVCFVLVGGVVLGLGAGAAAASAAR